MSVNEGHREDMERYEEQVLLANAKCYKISDRKFKFVVRKNNYCKLYEIVNGSTVMRFHGVSIEACFQYIYTTMKLGVGIYSIDELEEC